MEEHSNPSNHTICFQDYLKPYIILLLLQMLIWIFVKLALRLFIRKRRHEIFHANLQLSGSLLYESKKYTDKSAVDAMHKNSKLNDTNHSQMLELRIQDNYLKIKFEIPIFATVSANKKDKESNKRDLQDTLGYRNRQINGSRVLFSVDKSNVLLRVKRLGFRQRELLRRLRQSPRDALLQSFGSSKDDDVQRGPDYLDVEDMPLDKSNRATLKPLSSSPNTNTLSTASEWDPLSKLPSLQPLCELAETKRDN
ncbi:hypothetical protein EDC96DRAFT_523948, partial [Choanephora cucurbitarum]